MSRFGVVGDPIEHSKSPAMHAAAYRALGMAHTYVAIRARREELGGLVQRLRIGEFDGLNVTVPHKLAVLAFTDARDPWVDLVGAANTLVRTPEGKILASNTDAPALAEEIRGLAPECQDWSSRKALVLGTGGAALSAVAALVSSLRVAHVEIRGRAFDDPTRATVAREPFETLLAKAARGTTVSFAPLRPSATDSTFAVVLQGTSAGMTGAESGDTVANAVTWGALPASAVALDVVYAPPETPFVAAARSHGVRVANGFGMLARQGALAFEMWLHVPAPYNAMLTALV